jgi:hypothetical protein
VLRSWNASQLQPCRPWVTNNGAYPGQRTSSPGYGAAWTYISTATTATSADYCQDVGSYPYISATPAVTTRNAALAGGISALWLKALGLNGSLPCALGELKTVTSISLASNVLRGFLPPTLANLTALSAINLQLNRLQGSMPAAYGACKSAICRVRGPRALTAPQRRTGTLRKWRVSPAALLFTDGLPAAFARQLACRCVAHSR